MIRVDCGGGMGMVVVLVVVILVNGNGRCAGDEVVSYAMVTLYLCAISLCFPYVSITERN